MSGGSAHNPGFASNLFAHVSVGVHLAGGVRVGPGAWVGIGAAVVNGVSVCAGCTIGAGAVVVRDIDEPGAYAGVPARLLSAESRLGAR